MFIISLKNSPRREVISKRLHSLGLEFEFFDAVYGKYLGEAELKEVDFNFYPENYNAKKLTLGEIGCAKSHISLYEHMIKNNIPQAIIFEDDAIISHNFRELILSALDKLPAKGEILFLFHGKAKVYPFMRSLPERYRLARYRTPSKKSRRTIIGTVGYFITQKGAKKLLDVAYPIRMPSDFLTGGIQITGIIAYGIEPPCIFTDLHSEIDEIENRYE
ncbi:glycosyltransferase family 25 protein [Avibacterium paragallinarum]|uniref:glycosyltransferase family 25 protein n=1 Tax=Avibacterium paragallinarum TaxID=728 RepID=UPI000553502D|nr:glycosyltransferase family 25 protein [Avibacterium paragallinarum]